MDDLQVSGTNDYSDATSLGFGKLYDNMSEFIGTYEEAMQKKKETKKNSEKKKKKPRAVAANNLLNYIGE